MFLIFCSVAQVAAVYSQSRGLELKIFSHADQDITLGGASSDGVLSRAGRGGFFFQSCQSSIVKFRSRRSGIANKKSRRSGKAKFESRLSFLKSRTSARVDTVTPFSIRIQTLNRN